MQRLGKIRQLILDMDGVLWRGETPMPGLAQFFTDMAAMGIKLAVATNNATRTAEENVEQLAKFGVSIEQNMTIGSAEATASYLRHHYPNAKSAYVVGERGIRVELERVGFRVLPRPEKIQALTEVADFVAIGFDRKLRYTDLAVGALHALNGAKLIATNPDVTFPSEHGIIPGAGSTVAYLEAATGQKAFVVGKPNTPLFEEAMRRLGGTPETTAMVGDRLETDILGANRAGMTTIMVLSGISTRADVAKGDIKPDLILDDIRAISAEFKRLHGVS